MHMQCVVYSALRSPSFEPSSESVRGGVVWEGVAWEGVVVVQTPGREPVGRGAYAKRSSSVVVKGRLATASPSDLSEG